MKSIFFRILPVVMLVFMLDYCSSDNLESQDRAEPTIEVINYTYNSSELETMELINSYRISIGMNVLEKNNYISYKSEEHNNYMITHNMVNHDDFVARAQNIINVLGAKKVSENIAYNYNSPKAVFDAWMRSPKHKENITGDSSHFGISIRENPVNGKKYYTNIFVKL